MRADLRQGRLRRVREGAAGHERLRRIMNRYERAAMVVGLAATVLALGDSLRSFVAVGLLWKLVVVGLACALLVAPLARNLAAWTVRSTGYGRFGLAAAALLAASGGFMVLALLIAVRTPILLDERSAGGTSTATLVASHAGTSTVTIRLRSKTVATCTWRDAAPGALPGLDIRMLDWDSAVPKLRIDNFAAPQRVAVDCTPPTPVRDIRLDPPNAQIFLVEDLKRWLASIVTAGVLIWLIAFFRLRRFAR
jgi:hypothetical protein